jgi:LuxR family maltose regulon positive regulatory protein
LIAFEAGADEDADSFSRQALEIMRSGIADFPESVPCHALAARLACRRRSRDDALTHMAAAARVRPQLTHARPVLSVLYLTEMARAYADLEDVAGAREVLRQAREVLQRRPGLSDLSPALDRVADSLDRVRSVNVGASALTAAELRLVPYLRTHLTFPQIGERLFVSRNTVKSQAISVYQKLGVSSRAEAVQRLDELGLLDH